MSKESKHSPSVWKKIKSAFKNLAGGKKKTRLSMENEVFSGHSEEESKVLDLEEKWVNACQYTPGYNRKLLIYSVFDRVEESASSDSERILLFKKEASTEMLEWWNKLPNKPQKWEDLKSWLIEDSDSVEGMQRIRHAGLSDTDY
ncbi:uncharacterized protein NEMAJ01_0955 [Nematocida major]|uniref:uncharacterized protein n=1 Tax=Nematocida major TaxID=1912982 RepID=UPI0020074A0D|nr:uncharacterized protein NEMAJ01_0955 [Nematocida major]KAH9386059.1 hypothetical protein NEMAJ01_0955 [Nematocida major]